MVGLFLLCATVLALGCVFGYYYGKLSTKANFEPNTRVLGEVQSHKLLLYETALENELSYKEFARLKRIVFCESSWQKDAYNAKTHDYGYFQIARIHLAEATEMGLDVVNSPEDNIKFGVWLYDKSGVQPWVASKKCWG